MAATQPAKDTAIFQVTREPSPAKPGQTAVLGKRKRVPNKTHQISRRSEVVCSQTNEGSACAKEVQSMTFYDSTKVTNTSVSKRQRTDKASSFLVR